MNLLHHQITGTGGPAVVFVHGFTCAHDDWDAQVAAISPTHQTVAVDLRGHGQSPGTAADATIERYGADVAELMSALALGPVVLVGHSMGCRVVVEAALLAPQQVVGIILVDGSQLAPCMEEILKTCFAQPLGYEEMTKSWFAEMFTATSHPATQASVVDRSARLPREIGEHLITDLQRYDVQCFTQALSMIQAPVLAIQTTYINEIRERCSLTVGQDTPFLGMLRSAVRHLQVVVIPHTGHFPQLDKPSITSQIMLDFFADLPQRSIGE
jgi:pimeloyl-ACP methyl ester carboxylesterase